MGAGGVACTGAPAGENQICAQSSMKWTGMDPININENWSLAANEDTARGSRPGGMVAGGGCSGGIGGCTPPDDEYRQQERESENGETNENLADH